MVVMRCISVGGGWGVLVCDAVFTGWEGGRVSLYCSVND